MSFFKLLSPDTIALITFNCISMLLTACVGFPISRHVTYLLSKSKIKEGIVLKYIDESNEIYNEIDDLICFILNNKNVNEMNRRLGHLKTKLRKLKARVELNASALPLDSRSYKELKRSIEELLKKSSSVSPNVIVNFLLDSQKTLTYINDQLYLSIGLGNRITLRKFKRAIRAWFDSLMELQKKIQSMIKRFFR